MRIEQQRLRGGVTTLDQAVDVGHARQAQRLPVRQAEMSTEDLVFAAMELQQVRLDGLDDPGAFGRRKVAHERYQLRPVRLAACHLSQFGRLPAGDAARASFGKHQADVFDLQCAGDLDVDGPRQAAELDARYLHGHKGSSHSSQSGRPYPRI